MAWTTEHDIGTIAEAESILVADDVDETYTGQTGGAAVCITAT